MFNKKSSLKNSSNSSRRESKSRVSFGETMAEDTAVMVEWVAPSAPSRQKQLMLDSVDFRISLSVMTEKGREVKPEEYIVELWTNLYHQHNNEGAWHGVPLTHTGIRTLRDGGRVSLMYGTRLLLTCLGTYQFTFRLRQRFQHESKSRYVTDENRVVLTSNKEDISYIGTTQDDKSFAAGEVTVEQNVRDYCHWNQELKLSKITHNIYLGNYRAAREAWEHGFSCVLTAADDAPIFPMQLLEPLVYYSVPLKAGADQSVPDSVVCEAVNWLRAMSERCDKVLVHSRHGHGRAGCLIVAYVYAFNRSLNFQEVCTFVNKRHFVYTHRGLQASLERLYPRD